MKKDYLFRLKGMYFRPLQTVTGLKKEKGLKPSFRFLIISSLIAAVISILFEIAGGNPLIEELPLFVAGIANIVMVIAFDMILIFGISGLFHLLIRALGNKKPYYQTFKPFAYISCFWIITAMVAGLNSYIPFIWLVNSIILIWVLVLINTGLKLYTGLSSGRLFAAWLIVIAVSISVLYLLTDVFLAFTAA